MNRRFVYAILIFAFATMTVVGCGVPKSEHDKIVQELDRINQEKTALSDQVNTLKAENEGLTSKLSEMESQISTLKQENQDLAAKVAVKKPAASAKKK